LGRFQEQSDWTVSDQCHHRKAGAAIRVAEANIGLYHPCGLNTALESLAQGVPQVAIPVTYDQPGVAARMMEKRTGVVTSLDK
jgi:UDP:flavonoid glycosyltransferase YjiC (YdhE family)